MNYRHAYHAGNFADVMKHVLLIELIRGMQRKQKGFLYLDTHAGRGLYDLSEADKGDRLERAPEHPNGIGRLLAAKGLKGTLADYVSLVRECDRANGNIGDELRFYPGSPRIAQTLARPQDRVVLCEQHPAEAEALKHEFRIDMKTLIHAMNGYTGVKASLPPPERRALVLIDPPFEDSEEFARVGEAILEGLRRLPGAVFAVWYPFSERARSEEFLETVAGLKLPPTWTAELVVAGPEDGLSMRGSGLMVINPPWQLDQTVIPLLESMKGLLAQTGGAKARLRWLIPE